VENNEKMDREEIQRIFTHTQQVSAHVNVHPFIPITDRADLVSRMHECEAALVELEVATQKFHIKEKEIKLIASLTQIDFVRDDFRLKCAVKNAMYSALQFWQEPSQPILPNPAPSVARVSIPIE
jgi:hypothetical protein